MDFQTQLDGVWSLIRNRLFCEKTNLVYDYLTSVDPAKRFHHLPYPDEAAADYPNPCGWGSGMEDCMLNGGSVLEICRFRGDSEAREFACRIVDGMDLCIHAHGVPGFVARGITPRDGKSCYSNSSRDQFTLCVFGLWSFAMRFPGIPETYRDKAARLLVEIAGYCERTVTAANNYNLMRLDGKPAIVSEMVHVGCHEELRLPMFYCAAWAVTGADHWRECYLSWREAGIARTREYRTEPYWWDISLVQLQISLELLAECDGEKAKEYRQLQREIGRFSQPYLADAVQSAQAFAGDWNLAAEDWHIRPMATHHATIDPARGVPTLFYGKAYLSPFQRREFSEPAAMQRATGNLLIASALGGEGDTPLARQAAAIICKPDFARTCCAGGINLAHGVSLMRCAEKHSSSES